MRRLAVRDHVGAELALARPDYGLFGPASATWQLMGEPILWVAGIRALYLQALDPRQVPSSVAELDAYYAEARHRARAIAEAKKSLLMTFNPPVPPALFPLRLVTPAVDILAFTALPRWARRMYGAPGSPVTDRVVTAALRALYQATRVVPARLRYRPTVRHARQLVRGHQAQAR